MRVCHERNPLPNRLTTRPRSSLIEKRVRLRSWYRISLFLMIACASMFLDQPLVPRVSSCRQGILKYPVWGSIEPLSTWFFVLLDACPIREISLLQCLKRVVHLHDEVHAHLLPSALRHGLDHNMICRKFCNLCCSLFRGWYFALRSDDLLRLWCYKDTIGRDNTGVKYYSYTSVATEEYSGVK